MSKYDPLWDYLKSSAPSILTFEDVERICGIPINHSILTAMKELEFCSYRIGKISTKEKTVRIEKKSDEI